MATFGYTSIGGSNVDSGSGLFGQPLTIATRFLSSPIVGASTKVTAYMQSYTGSINVYAAIYADIMGTPGAEVAVSSVTSVTNTAGWFDFTLAQALQPNTYYWIAIWSGSRYWIYYDANGVTNQTVGVGVSGVGSPFPTTGLQYEPWQVSIYVTYTVGSGLSGWAVASTYYLGTAVNLPLAPTTIDDKNPSQIDEVGVDSGGTVLVSRFMKARKLTLSGSIYVSGYSNATLELSFLAPLRSMTRQQVTIIDPDSQFEGYWIMNEPDFKRIAEGASVRYTYTLTFSQGLTIVVL